MSTKSKMSDIYNKGGLQALGRSILDFIHFNVSKPWEHTVDINDIADFYEVNSDGLIPVDLPGYTLYLDPTDPGISTDILTRGIREPASYWVYRRELKHLPSDPIILEVGANIGYYAIAAAVTRPDATILCAELDEENTRRLRYNAKKNELLSQMQIENIALSDETTTRTATITDESNLHTLQADSTQDTSSVERIECVSGDEFLDQYGLDASEVDCIRMDVEGHESRILAGFSGLSPELAHIEVHPPYMYADEWRKLIKSLDSWNLNVATVAKGDKQFPVDTVKNIPVNRSHEVVLTNHGEHS